MREPGMRVLVAVGGALFRAGLVRLLEDLGAVEAMEAATLSQALERTDSTFAIALADPILLGQDGIPAFTARHPGVPLIVLGESEDPGEIVAAVRSGAKGYVPKSSTPRTLIAAIRLVLETGGPYLPPSLALGGMAAVAPPPAPVPPPPAPVPAPPAMPAPAPSPPPVPTAAPPASAAPASFPGPAPGSARPLLTPRQVDVLRLIAEGRTNREIAAALMITEGTAKLHVATVLKALGVTTRADAARRGEELGLVER